MEEVANTSAATIMLMGGASTQHDFKWTHERCMLLLHEYDLLKDKFKDRKHKKKDLWAEISMKFKKIYAYDLEWDVAYKKFRNLKQTFEQVRAKLQQQAITGQCSNRPKWPYFEKFQQILDDPVVATYSYADHHQQQQHQQQQQHLHHHSDEQEDDHHHHHHHHHNHHHHPHHKHLHPHLDPPTVDQVLAGEDFSDALVTVFPMNEELEIPAQTADDSVDEANGDQKEIVVQTASGEEEEEEGEEVEAGVNQDHVQEIVEEEDEEEVTLEHRDDDELEEVPHRKRFRRLSPYERERLMIEREKLVTLREIQRGIECKNDILRGILHVLQSRIWQAHPAMD